MSTIGALIYQISTEQSRGQWHLLETYDVIMRQSHLFCMLLWSGFMWLCNGDDIHCESIMTAFYSVDKWTRIDPATKTNLRFALYHKSFVERKQSARAAGIWVENQWWFISIVTYYNLIGIADFSFHCVILFQVADSHLLRWFRPVDQVGMY